MRASDVSWPTTILTSDEVEWLRCYAQALEAHDYESRATVLKQFISLPTTSGLSLVLAPLVGTLNKLLKNEINTFLIASDT